VSNFIVIHTASSLIVNVTSSTEAPKGNNTFRFIKVSDAVLNKFYRLAYKKNRNGTLVSVGELAAVSPAFLESLG
jgi:rRNA pseudouridine-1189 N-methylase Emg1 (Nep1/Mra1 family)